MSTLISMSNFHFNPCYLMKLWMKNRQNTDGAEETELTE